jgi:hypothetical protein
MSPAEIVSTLSSAPAKETGDEGFSDSGSSTDDEAFQSLMQTSKADRLRSMTHTLLGSLLRLNVAIRDPAPLDRYNRSRSIDVSHFESYDLEHVETLFPQLPGFLIRRLVNAILARRRFLEYSTKHHFKHSLGLDISRQEDDGPSAHLVLADNDNTKFSEKASTSAPPDLPISELFEKVNQERLETSSLTSYASSTGPSGRPKVPPPPEDANLGGDPFECPYCYLLVDILDTDAWR